MKNSKHFFAISCILLGLTFSFLSLTPLSALFAKADVLSVSLNNENENSNSTNQQGNIGVQVPFDGSGGIGDTFLSVYFDKEEYYDELSNVTSNIVGYHSTTSYVHVKDYVTTKVSQRPDATATYNTIDNLYYMLGILEQYANEYLTNTSGSLSIANVNDLMLGYLRSYNIAYDSGYNQKWTHCAGTIDTAFCNYVKNSESSQTGLKISEFFASFLQNSTDFNASLHGTVSSSFLEKHYTLRDPLGSGQGIDLIHMFAAMDGIYKYTGANSLALYLFFQQDHQQDLVSWLGDLHTFATEVFAATGNGGNWHDIRDYQASDGHIDFNEFVTNGIELTENENGELRPRFSPPTSFSSEDLLADLDAMNITRIFIDHRENYLRDCIMAYYKIMRQDSSLYGNRYYEFIYTCTRSLEWTTTNDLLTDFQREVYRSLNLERSSSGSCSSVEYYPQTSYDMSLLIIKDKNHLPNLGVCRYCANLFYDYITIMSHRFDE